MVVEGALALPGLPYCAHRADVVAHARCRWRPGKPVPALVVCLNLRSKPQIKASLRSLVKIPGDMRRDRRRARKGHCDRRAELDTLRDESRRRQRQEGVVGVLGRDDGIKAGSLGDLRDPLGLVKVGVRNLSYDAHALCPLVVWQRGGVSTACVRRVSSRRWRQRCRQRTCSRNG